MRKIIKYCLISFCLILIDKNIYCQAEMPDSTSVIDSSADSTHFELYLNPYAHEKRIFLGQKKYDTRSSTNFFSQSSVNEIAEGKTIADLKAEMKNYLKQRFRHKPDYDLGVFGEYLGYANAAATVILAIIHLSKYGFK